MGLHRVYIGFAWALSRDWAAWAFRKCYVGLKGHDPSSAESGGEANGQQNENLVICISMGSTKG